MVEEEIKKSDGELKGKKFDPDALSKELTAQTLKIKLPIWQKQAQQILDWAKVKASKGKFHSVSDLRYRNKNIPALVIGWGPSFHEHLDELAEIDLQIPTFVSDRCGKKMSKAGIPINIIGNLDSGPQINEFYKGWNSHGVEGVFAITTEMKNLKLFHGNRYWYIPAIHKDEAGPNENNFSEDWYHKFGRKLPVLPTNGNIGSTLANVAYYLGCKPIFLLGMDFGHDGREFETAANKNFTVKIPLKDGTQVTKCTDAAMLAYAHSFRKMIISINEDSRRPNMKVINLSDGLLHGDYLKDMRMDGFREFNERLKQQNFKENYWNLFRNIDSSQKNHEYNMQIINDLAKRGLISRAKQVA